MSYFIAMMRAGTAPQRFEIDRQFEIPSPIRGAQISPTVGDILFIWCERDGLIGEGKLSAVHEDNQIEFRSWCPYPEPWLPRTVLADTKHQPRPLVDDVVHFLGARRTHKTHHITAHLVSELDDLRRTNL